MLDCTHCLTLIAIGNHLTKIDDEPFFNITLYRSTIGALQYTTITRLEIAFPINKLSQFLAILTINY